MKRFLLLLLVAASLKSQSQAYNNEWIDYSKTYYKFKVAATRIHRIPQTTLAAYGIQNTPAEYLQLWRNGVQVPIYTSIQTGIFGPSDYIEFWGEMNDGKPDHDFFNNPLHQISDKHSMLSDSAVYFLTINPVPAQNKRLVPTANNVAGNVLPIEPFFMHTVGSQFKTKLHTGRAELVGDSYTYSSVFDYGEGWTSGDIATNAFVASNNSNLRVYTGPGAPSPTLKVTAAGNARNPRYYKVTLNGDSIAGETMNYYEVSHLQTPVDISRISGNVANIQIHNKSSMPVDRMVVATIELKYPRQFVMNSVNVFEFELPANANGNFLQFSAFAYAAWPPIIFDLTNGKRYIGDLGAAPLVRFALEPSATDRKLVLFSQLPSLPIVVNSLEEKVFVDFSKPENQGDYLIISNPMLTTSPTGSNPIEDYKSYRSSTAGGGFNAKVYMVQELIDQFGFGIKQNALGVRNFIRWARANFQTTPQYILLIGKGLVYPQARGYENNADFHKLALVPTFGYPASDNMLASEPGSSRPLTPIGRISAVHGYEVAAYLEKVIEYEQVRLVSSPLIADKAWMKNVVHVTGASEEAQQALLESALNGHKQIIEDTLYGGAVYSFNKHSASAVEQMNSAKLTQLFNEGIGILTYFGHSSASTLEFNLDNPQNYDNTGKYPVFIVMGCNAGNFFNFNAGRLFATESLSERYVLEPQKGSVAFLASSHLGIVHYLDIYNTKLYKAFSTTHYGLSIGKAMVEAINQVFNTYTENDFYARFQCEQFTLHGDPALKLYNFPKPDYVIEDQLVNISPSFVSIAEEEFVMDVKMMNIGMAVSDSIVVEVKRTYPDLTTEVIHRDTIPGIRYLDSLRYPIEIVATRDKGLNKITITVDADNVVDELYETNNSITKEVFIFEDEARPIYPYNYSIVNQQDIKLVVSSANAFAVSRDYLLEVDTTELFNSPLKVTRNLTSAGGVFEFSPGITFTDSTVYYWRVAPSAPTGTPKWNTSSFVYLPNSEPGFNQSHLYQHFKSRFDRLSLDSTSRKFEFGERHRNIFIRSGVFPTGFSQAAGFSVVIDEDDRIKSVCGISNIVFNVLDPVSLEPWFNGTTSALPGQYGSDPVCGENRMWNFQYNILDSAKRRMAMEFLDLIPDGHYVVVRNCSGVDPLSNTYAADWMNDQINLGAGNSIYHRLKDQGFATIDSFNRPRAFIFVYRKNHSEFVPRYTFSSGIYDAITLSVDLNTPDTLGYLTSPKFGPAKGWKDLKWRGSSADATEGDLPTVDVIGVNNAGMETPLFTGIGAAGQDFDISSIDALQYPYLKLRMKNQDSVNLTPYQLRYWRLTYIPVPEGAIAPNIYLNFKDTLEVGEPLNFGIGFKNISNVDFDSLKVRLNITGANNVVTEVNVPRQKELGTSSPNDTLMFNIALGTNLLPGRNVLYVNFNPDDDQPEHHTFNNFAFKEFYVKPDSLNPLLDVTFDGVHILNRDIVSSKPDIVVKLKDEAKWMILDDTSLVDLKVRYPNGSVRQYSFNNDTLQFTPAGQAPNEDNTATINFRPYFLEDGDYELIVTGKDKSQNQAGKIEYRVAFQVINKPMISNMLNYPNPFTTSTSFVFTITGSEVPQNIRIQILTITGKVVREITKDELGPLHIGRNITEFKWDGTDQYGQKLANGIYLYRVITNLNGKSLDKYRAEGDNTDKYFNKGYGKMYLMR